MGSSPAAAGGEALPPGRSGDGALRSSRRSWLEADRAVKWLPFVGVELFFLVLLLPFLILVYISFVGWRVSRGPWWEASFVGWDNYVEALFYNTSFLPAVGRTFAFAAIAVPVELVLGMALALLAYRSFPGRRFYLTAFLIPMVIVPAVVGYDLSMILVDSGPFNQILGFLAGRPLQIRWMSDPLAAQATVIMADVWQWTPLTFLIFVSGLSALPPEPIAAARVLGANTWQVFWKIQLPQLRPLVVIALVLRSMEALKMFDYPMLITQGGPGEATETLATYLFKAGWEHLNVSEAAAMSLALLPVIGCYIWLAIKLVARERRTIQEGAP